MDSDLVFEVMEGFGNRVAIIAPLCKCNNSTELYTLRYSNERFYVLYYFCCILLHNNERGERNRDEAW